jgi:predicted nuclease of restriction endonuclease-like RecB superfamily
LINKEDFIIKIESKCTRKQYKHHCDKCNSDLGYRRVNHKWSGYCRVCFNKIFHTNKTVSKETKQKMSKNHFLKNGGKHPLSGKQHSDKTKAKLSKAATEQNKKYQGLSLYVGVGGKIGMRSGWEVKYAKWLDNQKIEWEYEPTFELSNGKLYTPDFRLEDGTIVEIKGYFREDARIKWQMFKEEYPELKKLLLMKEQLKDLGVL